MRSPFGWQGGWQGLIGKRTGLGLARAAGENTISPAQSLCEFLPLRISVVQPTRLLLGLCSLPAGFDGIATGRLLHIAPFVHGPSNSAQFPNSPAEWLVLGLVSCRFDHI
jgi:hypothetical protein